VDIAPSSPDLRRVRANSAIILFDSCSGVMWEIREGKIEDELRAGGGELEGEDGAITS